LTKNIKMSAFSKRMKEEFKKIGLTLHKFNQHKFHSELLIIFPISSQDHNLIASNKM